VEQSAMRDGCFVKKVTLNGIFTHNDWGSILSNPEDSFGGQVQVGKDRRRNALVAAQQLPVVTPLCIQNTEG
jgi:hypothetical protein